MAVSVHGHCRRGVAEHPLHDLHVSACRDRQGCSGMPESVRRQALYPDLGTCTVERSSVFLDGQQPRGMEPTEWLDLDEARDLGRALAVRRTGSEPNAVGIRGVARVAVSWPVRAQL